jgi:hypothetical protein
MRRLLAGVLLLIVAAWCAGCGSGSTTTVTVSSHSAPLVVLTAAEHAGETCPPATAHPAELLLACGMGYPLSHLVWHHWGEPVTYAEGIAKVNDCQPSCAKGKTTARRIQVIASQIETCANGQRRYTKLTWSFPGGYPPPGPESGPGQEVRLPCPNT